MESGYQESCPKCGMTREELIEKKVLGCSKCCEVFPWEIRNILLELQGCTQYKGNEEKEEHNTRSRDIGSLFDEESEKMFEKTIPEESDDAFEETAEASEEVEEKENEERDFDKDMQKFISLSSALRAAVAEENYERAAQIRDEMKSLSDKREETEGKH